jgi:hypothetical protein
MEEGPESASLLRAVLGVVALLTSFVVIPIGFVLLIIDLEQSSMVRPLATLMAGGFLLASGIALLIWEMSVRYGIRR